MQITSDHDVCTIDCTQLPQQSFDGKDQPCSKVKDRSHCLENDCIFMANDTWTETNA
jgi:hypothetical protein